MTNPSQSFLLLIGDDGALLLPPQSKGASPALFAASHTEANIAPLIARMKKETRTPIILLADTLVQNIKRESLPRVSIFDRRKIIARRLDQAFPRHPLSTSIVDGRHEALLLALETKGAVDLWLKELYALPNFFGVCCLFPVECVSLVTALAPEAKDGWGLLLLANQTGGMRQIVTHKGRFLFTRLTPRPNLQNGTKHQATELTAEIKATRDYLLRFGLMADTPLHLAALLPSALRDELTNMRLDVTTKRLLTIRDAAQTLRLPSAPSTENGAADLIALLWLAKRAKLNAPLIPLTHRAMHQRYRMEKTAKNATKTIAAFGVVLSLWHGLALLAPLEKLNATKADVLRLETTIQQAKTTLAPAAAPLERLQRAAERQRLFAPKEPAFLTLLTPLSETLGDDFRVTALRVQQGLLVMDIAYLGKESFKNQVIAPIFDSLLQKLRQRLPSHAIELTPPPETALSSARLSNETDSAPKQATLTIRMGGEP